MIFKIANSIRYFLFFVLFTGSIWNYAVWLDKLLNHKHLKEGIREEIYSVTKESILQQFKNPSNLVK